MMQSEQMNPSKPDHEWLSGLLDGELEDDESHRVLKRMAQDPEMAVRWSEYCLIGDALRGQVRAQPGLRGRVQVALQAEPTVLAPLKSKAMPRPLVWSAAAAAVAAVTWTVWTALPQQELPVQLAAKPAVPLVEADQVIPYLAAHQDYAQAVIAHPEMHFTPVTLATLEGGR